MPDPLALLGFTAASMLVLLTPGPGVAYVVARSLAQGQHAGLVSAAGLAVGVLPHALAAADLQIDRQLHIARADDARFTLLGEMIGFDHEIASSIGGAHGSDTFPDSREHDSSPFEAVQRPRG